MAGIPRGAIAGPGTADLTRCGAIATRPAPSRGTALLVWTLACLCSTSAIAQWNAHSTASLGRGYGNIALSQSILSGTRRLGASARATAPRPASLTPAQIEAALTYTADPQQSDRIRAAMIDTVSGQNPATRADMEKAFADDAVLKEFERFMSGRGYSSRNVADAMAELLVVCWEIFTDGTASKAQIQGTHRQIRGVFLGTPALRAMTNAQRQPPIRLRLSSWPGKRRCAAATRSSSRRYDNRRPPCCLPRSASIFHGNGSPKTGSAASLDPDV